jgi:YVTN family beta-propeller protein
MTRASRLPEFLTAPTVCLYSVPSPELESASSPKNMTTNPLPRPERPSFFPKLPSVGCVRSLGLLLAVLSVLPAYAQNVTATVAAGTNPSAIAVNPVTNTVYVANSTSSNVTVIDGATNATTTVPVGPAPEGITVDSATNQIYVADQGTAGASVITGPTNGAGAAVTGMLVAFAYPAAIAVNPVTDTIYLLGPDSSNPLGSLLFQDKGTTGDSIFAIPLDGEPSALAVNPVTDMIYINNGVNVAVIDGSVNPEVEMPTFLTTTGVGLGPIAVNTATNQVYLSNSGSNNVTVIDGATNALTYIAVGNGPGALAVNMVTNTVYVANQMDNTVTVIDGASHATTTVPVGTRPVDIAVNSTTNVVYVANSGSNNVTAIDGITNATTTVSAGSMPVAIAVNAVTNTVYVANNQSNNVTVFQGLAGTPAPSPTPTPTPTPAPPSGNASARLINISTRAEVGTGANILIPGFVISGSGTETLLIRADGPALAGFGVAGALAQPSLSVYDGAGTVVASNTGWGTNTNPAQISGAAASVGAFALASGSADCALLASLPAGAYTVQVSGVGNSTGVALAEVYEVASGGTRLANISTRALVGTGANIIIPGFVVAGSGSEQLLARGDGPALTGFGVGGALAQPSLSVYNSSGSVIASNTGWGTGTDPSQITSAGASVGAFALAAGSADSALIVNVAAGAYTMQLSGVGNSTGVALAEVYEVP